jgi:non-specific serine/threonine protein kinase/serine/threonine-protein kinase
MEFVSGEPITVYCDRHHLDTHQRLELFIPACEAIQHAHQKAIIHRDLKPSNILVALVDGKPQVKIIDFGVAKAISHRLSERTFFTETGQLIGTPEYMSPEQAETAGTDIDTRTDIYSLGVVLYELLIGTLPVDPHTLRSAAYAEIQRIIREVDPPRPSTRFSGLGDIAAVEIAKRRRTQVEALTRQLRSELEWIPLKAMRKERTERYRTAVELAEDIRAYLSNRPLLAAPESPAYRLRKFLRRNRRGVAASAAMILLLITGIAATTWQAIRATRAERQTRATLHKLEIADASNRAVNEFLTIDLLHSADPSITHGEERTIKQAVDDASRTIDSKFKGQPLVAASIRQTLAVTYDGLGRADLGLPHAQWTLEQRRKLLGNDNPETIDAQCTVVSLLYTLGRADEAEPLARDALERARRLLPPGDRVRLAATSNLAHVLHDKKVSEAETLYRQDLDECRQVLGLDDPETLTAMNNMASILMTQGRGAEAESLFRELLRAQTAKLSSDDPQVIISKSNLAMSLFRQHKLDEAERVYREALAAAKRVLKVEHPGTIGIMRNLANVLEDQGKLDEAESLLREALALFRRTETDDHPDTIGTANNLASVLKARGKAAEALPLYREVLERCRKVLGPDHPFTVISLNNYGQALVETDHIEQAEPLFAEGYKKVASGAVEVEPTVAAVLAARWGTALVKLGRYDKAEEPLRDALKRLPGANIPDKSFTTGSLVALAEVCDHTNRADEAARYRAEASKLNPPAATTRSKQTTQATQ